MTSEQKSSLAIEAERLLKRRPYERCTAPKFALRLSAGEEACAMEGFLGTHAGFLADLNLVIQVAMGVALIFGAFLARAKRFASHGICQSIVLVLNALMIGLVMWPSFYSQVLPKLPKRFGRRFYAVATIHGVLGVLAEILGLYIVMVAGTGILPKSWRFQRWKLWMRIELVLWWIVLLAGLGTYWVWYAA
jgi:uncharacterized membrane protein YozB (DUF420 family)